MKYQAIHKSPRRKLLKIYLATYGIYFGLALLVAGGLAGIFALLSVIDWSEVSGFFVAVFLPASLVALAFSILSYIIQSVIISFSPKEILYNNQEINYKQKTIKISDITRMESPYIVGRFGSRTRIGSLVIYYQTINKIRKIRFRFDSYDQTNDLKVILLRQNNLLHEKRLENFLQKKTVAKNSMVYLNEGKLVIKNTLVNKKKPKPAMIDINELKKVRLQFYDVNCVRHCHLFYGNNRIDINAEGKKTNEQLAILLSQVSELEIRTTEMESYFKLKK